jgi:Phospholipase_D-nuclease N-terminal/Short C-terminal domain
MLATTFWESFFLFMLFLPLALLWATALADIVRRDDMSGRAKALWVVCVILVPFLGTLIYLVTRPRVATYEERPAVEGTSRTRFAPSDELSELTALADLHDRGKLTDSEFAAEKARLLGAESVPA